MSQRTMRISVFSVAILAFSMVTVTAFAQESKGSDDQMKSDHMKSSKGSKSVTGCLQKGSESGGYYITDADGKTWELSSKKVDLSEHVGHQVTAMGKPAKGTKAKEKMKAMDEKKEAGGNEYSDLHVSKLEMVSESCK